MSQDAELKDLKAAVPWMKEAPHHCLVQALRDLDDAFKRFFSGQNGYPKFQKKGQNDSFRFPDPKQIKLDCSGLQVSNDGRVVKTTSGQDHNFRLFLPKAGWVAAVLHRPLPAGSRLCSITVSRHAGAWMASMLFEDDNAAPKLELGALSDAEFEALIDNAIAFDFGVVQPMTGSDGSVYDLPRTEIRHKRRIKRLHRAIDRCKKGSKNRRKAQNRLARFQVKLARRRSDARHKLTTTVAKSHGIVIVEDLRIKNMTASARGTIEEPGSNIAQKAGLNTSILDLSPGAIFRDLGYKLGWRGGLLLAVDPRYTSQTCSNPACGHCSAENRRSQAEFVCEKCGLSLNADINAARNIRARGIALLRALRAESLAVTVRNPAATARRTRPSARGPRVAACRGPGVGRPGTQEARRSVSSILRQENPRGRDLKEAAE